MTEEKLRKVFKSLYKQQVLLKVEEADITFLQPVFDVVYVTKQRVKIILVFFYPRLSVAHAKKKKKWNNILPF